MKFNEPNNCPRLMQQLSTASKHWIFCNKNKVKCKFRTTNGSPMKTVMLKYISFIIIQQGNPYSLTSCRHWLVARTRFLIGGPMSINLETKKYNLFLLVIACDKHDQSKTSIFCSDSSTNRRLELLFNPNDCSSFGSKGMI